MRVKHHISFLASSKIVSVLNTLQIKYDMAPLPPLSNEALLLSFDIYEDCECYPFLTRQLPYNYLDIASLEYTKQELLSADWLTVCCRIEELELAQNEDVFLVSDPSAKNKCNHRKLKCTQFYMKKPVKWRKKHFASTFELGSSHLFCDEYAKALLDSFNVRVCFENVFHFRTGNKIDNVFYMNLQDILPQSAIVLCGSEQKDICNTCKRLQYGISGAYQLQIRGQFLQGKTGFCKTPDIFGYGSYFSEPFNIVSQELYRYIIENGLSNNLVFQPILIVD